MITHRLHQVFTVLFVACFIQPVMSQSFPGYHATSYAGVYGTLYNPANILDHRVRADVNLAGLYAGLENNVISLNAGNASEPATFSNPISRVGRGGMQLDALGPGFMLRLSDQQALAVTTRFRFSANADRLDNNLLNIALQDDATRWNGSTIAIKGGSLQAHSWNELAFTYSRQIGVSDFGVWKAALSVKLLGGQGGAYLMSDHLSFVYNDSMRSDSVLHLKYGGALQSAGNINVNYSAFMDDWDNGYQYHFFRQPGLGADIGVTYEYRNEMQVYEAKYNEATLNYKWKAGVSLTDIGSIRYRSSPNSYNTHLGGQSYVFEDLKPPPDSTTLVSISNFYKRKFPGTPSDTYFTMMLPTTLHLMFDYSLNKWLSAEAHVQLPVITSQPAYYIGTHTLSTISVTPRAELPWAGLYVPLSYQLAGGFRVGTALRLGPVVIGSGSIISTGLLRKTRSADAYMIVRVPFFGYREYESDDSQPATKLGKLARRIFRCQW